MLLVLALVWGTFLVWWLHSRAQGTFGDSIGTFRRHLTVLERTAPSTVLPANRLRTSPQMVPAYRPRSAAAGVPAAPRRSQGAGPRTSMQVVQRRRQTLRRRRDVLFVLAIAVVATLIMAAATRTSAIIFLQLLADASMVSYIGLLVRMRNLSAERDLKLTYLPRDRTRQRAGSGGRSQAASDGFAETGYESAFYGAVAPGQVAGGHGAVATGQGAGRYRAGDQRAASFGAVGRRAAGSDAAGRRAAASSAATSRRASQGQRAAAPRGMGRGHGAAASRGASQGQRAAGRSVVPRNRAFAYGAAG